MRIINKLFLVSILSASTIFGCSTISGDVKNPSYDQLVEKDTTFVKNSSRIATRVFLLTLKDQEDQKKAVEFIKEIVPQIRSISSSPSITIENVRTYALNIINNSKVKHKEEVGLLIDSIAVSIQEAVGNKELVNVSQDKKADAIRKLILSAADGILDASSVYPTTQP